jgi:hypothetical protein
MATLAEMLRQGADRLVNLPSEAQRFITNPQAFTQLLTGKNPLPRETGFAAGAMSLPPTEMSVLDPNQAPYMQGYEQGEPFGVAAMALPFAAPAAVATAKALAPKAGQMAENYMVRQGMIQPLTAYHGTPHTIQGQFDINKVGTGEGAQAYGHGMYFAENPAVAKEYSKMSPAGGAQPSPRRAIGGTEVEPMTPEYKAAQLVDEMGLAKAKKFVADWSKNPTPEQVDFVQGIQNSLLGITKKSDVKNLGTGNLYKVDIPDADIPNMLDWDKPLSKMTERESAIIEPLKQKLIASKNPYNPESFETIGQIIQSSRGSNPNLEKELAKAGFTGIRYLDEGSRNAGKGTSNFVVFDPSNVKILEENSKPVSRKEIIEKQVKALKE